MPASSDPAITASTTRPEAPNTAARGAQCRLSTNHPPASATTTAAEESAPRRRQRGGSGSSHALFLLAVLLAAASPLAHACDHHDAVTTTTTTTTTATTTTTPWPDAVSPATRRRLLARANTNPSSSWEQPLGVDRHGRRRSLLSSTLRRCGTHAPEPAALQRLERAHAVRGARESARADDNTPRTIEVPTHVTVVLRENDGAQLVSDATVRAQLDALDKAYGGSPFKWVFVLKSLTRVKTGSPGNAGMCDPNVEAKVKKERRQGGAGALNLYIADLSDCGLLGYSSWPWERAEKGEANDGVVVHSGTTPGGTYKPYNMGFTAVHELGHWFGLYHTFQNGCSGAGDSVADTNYIAIPTEGCPKARDTCRDQPGGDPVTNPMDYTDDACMQGFTVGQQQRMESLYRMYRGGGGGGGTSA